MDHRSTCENSEYLKTQIITYIGNKRSLIPFIGEALQMVKEELGQDRLALGDLFSGSGIVARYFKAHASYLAVNDLENYCETLSRCYLSNSDQREDKRLQDAYAWLKESLREDALAPGFITRLYAPKDEQNIQPDERVFYTPRNAMFLDTARQAIGRLSPALRSFFLAPLLTEASVKTNTSGVFKGFYKNSSTGVGQFGGNGQAALSRILSPIGLPFPVFSRFDCPVDIFRQDAGRLAPQLPPLDLLYLDPPYNQHPYGSNYFMLNLINGYEEPQDISRVSGIPVSWNRSVYNQSGRALSALSELCAAAPARYLLISFNSEGFITRDQMEEMLSKIGSIRVLEQTYNTFRGSRNLGARAIHTKEYLFLINKNIL